MKIIALGPKGSYGHEAGQIARRKLGLGEETPICFVSTNVGILQAAESEAEFAVIPVENSTYGDVVDVLGYLAKQSASYSLRIIGQVELPVRHCLVVSQDIQSVSELKGITSHPQAIGQCVESIGRWKIAQIEPTNSTAAAAKFVAEHPEKKIGAITSALAAEEYGLKILERDVQTRSDNTTRFLVFGPKGEAKSEPTGNDKTVIIFQTRNKPGALLCSLLPLGLLGINMTAIHSVSQGGWRYRFYAEVDGHTADFRMRVAFKVMRFFVNDLLVLGSFPK